MPSTRRPNSCPPRSKYSHAILRRLAEVRKSGAEPTLGPDAKKPADRALRGRQARGRHVDRVVDAASRRGHDLGRCARRGGALHPRGSAFGLDHRGDEMVGQPDRQVRHRRPGRGCGPDGAQDHRRHLWRCRAPWRRRVLGQGPDQGGPFGRLCRALPGEERGGRGSRETLHDPAVLRHRRGRAAVDLCRHPWHGRRPGRGDRGGHRQGHGPDAAPVSARICS